MNKKPFDKLRGTGQQLATVAIDCIRTRPGWDRE